MPSSRPFPSGTCPSSIPVNVAYEAATADIRDFNLIDPFHLEAYDRKAVNYNRDVEVFPVLRRILEKITGGESFYKSPTDMGVNRAGFAIVDDGAVPRSRHPGDHPAVFPLPLRIRHGVHGQGDGAAGGAFHQGLPRSSRSTGAWSTGPQAAEEAQETGKGNEGIYCGAAIDLQDGTIVTGSNSPLMHAASSLVLNAIKHLAGIPDKIKLLPPYIMDSVRTAQDRDPERKEHQPRPRRDAHRPELSRHAPIRRPSWPWRS